MNCPKCQSPISADWQSCTKCGEQLNQLPMGVPVTEVKRPSRWQYFVGIAIIIITSIIAAVLLITGSLEFVKPDMHVTVPGTSQLNLDKGGYYFIFCEEDASSSGSCDAISDMDINLYDSASNPVELTYPSGDINYKINDKSYSSVFDFTIDDPGTYTINVSYPAGKSGPDAVLAISCFDFVEVLGKAFAVGTIGLIIGLIIIIRAAIVRRSVGRRANVTPVDRFWA